MPLSLEPQADSLESVETLLFSEGPLLLEEALLE
jgi:hypothetical protein